MRILIMVIYVALLAANLHTVYLGIDLYLYKNTPTAKALMLSGIGLVLSGICVILFFRIFKDRRF